MISLTGWAQRFGKDARARRGKGAAAGCGKAAATTADSANAADRERADLRSLYTLTQQARAGWEEAWRFFHQAVEPDMVDNAVFTLNAAEKRYDYFIKQAKARNLRNGGIPYDD
jgi:hypothetical protein